MAKHFAGFRSYFGTTSQTLSSAPNLQNLASAASADPHKGLIECCDGIGSMIFREFKTVTPTTINVGPIRVIVRVSQQLLNPIDPLSLRKRDIDTGTEQFIINWARDLPSRELLSLVIQLDGHPARRDESAAVIDAIHAYFARKSATARRELRHLLRLGRASLVIGLAFLSICVTVANYASKSWGTGGASDIVREGLTVAGWVSMWRPKEVFLYDWWPLVGERRLYDRLSRMPVTVEPLEDS
jgi:hypothetical protein